MDKIPKHRYKKRKDNTEAVFKDNNLGISETKDNGMQNAGLPKKKMNKAVKIVLIILCVIFLIIAVFMGTITAMSYVGKNQIGKNSQNAGISTPDSALVDTQSNGRTVKYNGKEYVLNDSVISVLCIGVDKKGEMGTVDGIVGTGGQADALYLMALDTKTNKCSVIGISRDSVVDVDVYSAGGEYIGLKPMQACLSYAYGDGEKASCENTLKAVSRLLYGMNIDLYYAVDLETIDYINDAVGGVTVTPESDTYLKGVDMYLYAGQPVTLYGRQAQAFVRERDINSLDSNNDRMKRQMQYITAFMNQTFSATKSDLSVPLDIYKQLKSYSVTNLTVSKLTYLVTNMFSNGVPSLEVSSIKGSVDTLNGSAAFYPDETDLLETLLKNFYVCVDDKAENNMAVGTEN